jgi:hypothetical protein
MTVLIVIPNWSSLQVFWTIRDYETKVLQRNMSKLNDKPIPRHTLRYDIQNYAHATCTATAPRFFSELNGKT